MLYYYNPLSWFGARGWFDKFVCWIIGYDDDDDDFNDDDAGGIGGVFK